MTDLILNLAVNIVVTAAVTGLIALIPADRWASPSSRRSLIWTAVIAWPLAVIALVFVSISSALNRNDGAQK